MAESVSVKFNGRAVRSYLPILFACGLLATTSFALAENLPDPTRPSGFPSGGQQGTPAVTATGPVLQSVFVSPGRKTAIISGQTVSLGDKFGDAKVIKITETEVTLSSGNQLQILKLFPGVEKRPLSDRTPSQAGLRWQ